MTFDNIQEAKIIVKLLEEAQQEYEEQLEWDYMKHTDIRQ